MLWEHFAPSTVLGAPFVHLCDEIGRDYDSIEKTAPFLFDVGEHGEKVPELLEKLRWLSGMGVETVFGWVVGVDRVDPIEIMGSEVVPAAADLH